jgi:alkylhydroperoxidase family enzyme
MTQFPLHTLSTAPAPSRAILAQAMSGERQAPNLLRALAEAPAALSAFQQLQSTFATSSLTPLEQEVVYLSAAKSNACHYCVTQSGMFDESPEAEAASDDIRTERPLPTARLQALRRFTIAVTEQRGWVSDRDIDDFMEAGFNRSQVLEVICGVSLANLSSYVNHVAATPVDGGFYPTALDA